MLGRVLAAAWAAAVVIEVVVIVDAATDRRVSRGLQRRAQLAHERINAERQLRRESRWVVFEAHEATREASR